MPTARLSLGRRQTVEGISLGHELQLVGAAVLPEHGVEGNGRDCLNACGRTRTTPFCGRAKAGAPGTASSTTSLTARARSRRSRRCI